MEKTWPFFCQLPRSKHGAQKQSLKNVQFLKTVFAYFAQPQPLDSVNWKWHFLKNPLHSFYKGGLTSKLISLLSFFLFTSEHLESIFNRTGNFFHITRWPFEITHFLLTKMYKRDEAVETVKQKSTILGMNKTIQHFIYTFTFKIQTSSIIFLLVWQWPGPASTCNK